MQRIDILIPAHNEADYLQPCLDAVFASAPPDNAEVTVIVIANACTDETAQIARSFWTQAQALAWKLVVIETEIPGKLLALNLGEEGLPDSTRLYLDADVVVSHRLIADLAQALDDSAALYASGTPNVIAPPSKLIARYAGFWSKLPFVSQGVPGFGIFAVNAAGRARWGLFPNIISDDSFVRLQFNSDERIKVEAPYSWPMVDGLRNLVRVRRRQDQGVLEIEKHFPELHQGKRSTRPSMGFLMRRFAADPLGFLAYCFVSVVVRLPIFRTAGTWVRGR